MFKPKQTLLNLAQTCSTFSSISKRRRSKKGWRRRRGDEEKRKRGEEH
jgi:hypothetical protein